MTAIQPPASSERPGILGAARTSLKLVDIMARTVKHMILLPREYTQKEVCMLAQVWARDLLDAAQIKLEVDGEQPPWGVLHVSNHRSFMDILVLMSVAPGTFLSKAEVEGWPIIGKAATMAGTVYVKRDMRDSRKAARETLRELLEEGISVTVFPEGTTASYTNMLPFRPGAVEVAAEVGTPIVPIAIEYPRVSDAWINDEPIGQYFMRVFNRPMTVRVKIGPIMRGEDGEALCEEAKQWISASLDELHEELHGAE